MIEYFIIVIMITLGTVAAVRRFGVVARAQTGNMAMELSGQTGDLNTVDPGDGDVGGGFGGGGSGDTGGVIGGGGGDVSGGGLGGGDTGGGFVSGGGGGSSGGGSGGSGSGSGGGGGSSGGDDGGPVCTGD